MATCLYQGSLGHLGMSTAQLLGLKEGKDIPKKAADEKSLITFARWFDYS
jgi:hypothetical protein